MKYGMVFTKTQLHHDNICKMWKLLNLQTSIYDKKLSSYERKAMNVGIFYHAYWKEALNKITHYAPWWNPISNTKLL